MKLNYFRNVTNFGDALSRPLVEELAKRRVTEAANLTQCDMMAAGSIGWSGRLFNPKFKSGVSSAVLHMWGFGFMLPYDARHTAVPNRMIDVRAVRGTLSLSDLRKAGLVGSGDSVALGDPGLFYADLVPDSRRISKKYDLALVPHRLDWRAGERLAEKVAATGISVKYVDPMNINPFDCIREIAASRKVLSSALHALVVADSLSIPNCRLVFSGYEEDAVRKVEQSNFRFEDYYSAFGMKAPKALREEDVLSNPKAVLDGNGGFGCVPSEKVKACRMALLKAFPLPHSDMVCALSPEAEREVCYDISRDVRIAVESQSAEMQALLAEARMERNRLKRYSVVQKAEMDAKDKELKILRDSRNEIERIVYGPNAARKMVMVFGKNGGIGGDDAVPVVVGAPLPSIAVPSLAGHDFGGYWDTVKSGGTQYYDGNGNGLRNADANMPLRLYALWKERL